MLACESLPCRLDPDEPRRGFADEARHEADRVRAAADARDRDIREPALDRADLLRGLVADDPLEVAHERGERMRTDSRPEDVVGRRDVRDPVAHRLVDGVLQGGRPRRHLADLGAERAHPQHVRRLAADVLSTHVHDAFEVEERAGGRRRDAVLACPGLGDDPSLAEAAGQERLAEGVVDLVGTGVVESSRLRYRRRRPASRPPLVSSARASRSAR